MSHYGVVVFSDSYHDSSFYKLLEPYDETNHKYMTFHPKEYTEIKKDFERFKEMNPTWTIDMYIDSFGYVKHNGHFGSWYNDNARYDYYSLDARAWDEEALIPDGTIQYDKHHRWRKSQIVLKDDKDVPIAFVTPDGVWHEAGRVGWFATCNDTPESWAKHIKEFKEFLAAPGDEYVSFVDCHI